jgi:acyl-coenzyme A synthetase/AMP-(fatty) acid ligase
MFDLLRLPDVSRAREDVVAWRGGVPVSQGEFLGKIAAWQTLLRHQAGERFAIYMADSIEFAAALFGAWHAGKTIYLPADALPGTCASLAQSVNGFIGEFPEECSPLALPDGGTAHLSPNLAPLDPGFVGLTVFTSGSTGLPQAISKKLSQLATEVATLETIFGAQLGTADIVATVSHQHIYGLLFKLLWPLAAGRTIHARSFAYPEELAAATAQRECVLISSPAHIKRLPESEAWTAAKHRIRAVFSSGGPLPLETAHDTARLLGHAPIEVYGSSETGGIAWRRRSPGSDEGWTAMPGVQWRIAPDSEALEVRSPHLPDEEWFRTADRVRAADDGTFLLLGRADRIVKIEEKRISLDMMEVRLTESPMVAQARVLVQDGKRQTVAAFVVLSDDGRQKLERDGKLALNTELRAVLARSMERVALPRSWHYLDAFPVNAQGKTTYAELMASLQKENVRNADAPITMPRRRILQSDAQRIVFELSAPQDLAYFDGHFPAFPILPGVVQVEWAIAFGREHFDLPAGFRGMQALKFHHVIRPEAPVVLELQHDAAKASLAFKYSSAANLHSSGCILFGGGDV